jgi:proline iminopeptidase
VIIGDLVMSTRMTTVSIAAALIAILLIGCEPERGLSPGEGYVDVPGGQVWYRIAGSGRATPLLVLHGGPVFYDQLGAGHSVAPADTTLWRVDRFVRELAQVREALGLEEVHILGHSWGSMLAVDYMLTQPTGVRSLVLASPALSVPRWVRDADSLKTTLPDSLQAIISHHEASGTTDSPEYQGAVIEFYRQFFARRRPWSADIDSAVAQFNTDVYGYMWGPSEFAATGTLKDYDRTDRLRELGLPVLFTAGRYDEATPSTVAFFQSQVPGAELAILEASAHLTMQDEPEEYVRIIRDFLRRVEQR